MENRSNFSFLIFIGIFLLAFLTNPDFNRHVNKIDEVYDEKNPITGMLVNPWVIKRVTYYHDYYFFSTTTCNGKVVSIGAFSKVGIVMDLDISSNDVANCFLNKSKD